MFKSYRKSSLQTVTYVMLRIELFKPDFQQWHCRALGHLKVSNLYCSENPFFYILCIKPTLNWSLSQVLSLNPKSCNLLFLCATELHCWSWHDWKKRTLGSCSFIIGIVIVWIQSYNAPCCCSKYLLKNQIWINDENSPQWINPLFTPVWEMFALSYSGQLLQNII